VSQTNIPKTETAALRDLLASAAPDLIAALVARLEPPAPPLAGSPGLPAPDRIELRELAVAGSDTWHTLRPLATARHNGSSDTALFISAALVRNLASELTGNTRLQLPKLNRIEPDAPVKFVWRRKHFWLVSRFTYDFEAPVPPGCVRIKDAGRGRGQIVVGAYVRDRLGKEYEAYWLVSAASGRQPKVREPGAVWMMREVAV